MLDYDKMVSGVFGTAVSAVGAGLSVTDLQAIVSIIATVVGLLITITSSIIIPLWRKWLKAKEDGKITPDELEDMVDTVDKGIREIKSPKDNDK